MNNSLKNILLSLFILTQFACSESKSSLNNELNRLATEIETSDSLRIKNITTNKGYTSILEWSENLSNRQFISGLVNNLIHYVPKKGFDHDSLLILSLGKSDPITGSTGGYLVLRKINNEIKIDEYRGGK